MTPRTYFEYSNKDLLRQKIYQILAGYLEDDAADQIVKGPQPSAKTCFIHRDYHPTNVLYHKGKVSGIVDRVNACRGPAGIGVGHCRVNLALLYDVITTDRFLVEYQQDQGSAFTYDVYWDLVSVMDIFFGPPKVNPGWEGLGATGLTDKMIEESDWILT
ncbi:phosphotransferase [Virgibacillus dakarensis]|nr:phosphotransferase [Virgibacillus dakarensis]